MSEGEKFKIKDVALNFIKDVTLNFNSKHRWEEM